MSFCPVRKRGKELRKKKNGEYIPLPPPLLLGRGIKKSPTAAEMH